MNHSQLFLYSCGVLGFGIGLGFALGQEYERQKGKKRVKENGGRKS